MSDQTGGENRGERKGGGAEVQPTTEEATPRHVDLAAGNPGGAELEIGALVVFSSPSKCGSMIMYRCDEKETKVAELSCGDLFKGQGAITQKDWSNLALTTGEYKIELKPLEENKNSVIAKVWLYHPQSVRDVKLTIHATRSRGRGAHGVQLSLLKLYDKDGKDIEVSYGEVPGSSCPPHETVANLFDDDKNSKYFDNSMNWLNLRPIIIHLPRRYLVASFEMWTANDVPERDPVLWTLAGRSSKDKPWRLLHSQLDINQMNSIAPYERRHSYGRMNVKSELLQLHFNASPATSQTTSAIFPAVSKTAMKNKQMETVNGTWQAAGGLSTSTSCHFHPTLITTRINQSIHHMLCGGEDTPHAVIDLQISSMRAGRSDAKRRLKSKCYLGCVDLLEPLHEDVHRCLGFTYGGGAYLFGGVPTEKDAHNSKSTYIKLWRYSVIDGWQRLGSPPQNLLSTASQSIPNKTKHLNYPPGGVIGDHLVVILGNSILMYHLRRRIWMKINQKTISADHYAVATTPTSLWLLAPKPSDGNSTIVHELRFSPSSPQKMGSFSPVSHPEASLSSVKMTINGTIAECKRHGAVVQSCDLGPCTGSAYFSVKLIKTPVGTITHTLTVGVATRLTGNSKHSSKIWGVSFADGAWTGCSGCSLSLGDAAPEDNNDSKKRSTRSNLNKGDVLSIRVVSDEVVISLNAKEFARFSGVPLDVYPTVRLGKIGQMVMMDYKTDVLTQEPTWHTHDLLSSPSPRLDAAICVVPAQERKSQLSPLSPTHRIFLSGGSSLGSSKSNSDLYLLEIYPDDAKSRCCWKMVLQSLDVRSLSNTNQVLSDAQMKRRGHALGYDPDLDALIMAGGHARDDNYHVLVMPLVSIHRTDSTSRQDEKEQNTASIPWVSKAENILDPIVHYANGTWRRMRPTSSGFFEAHTSHSSLLSLTVTPDQNLEAERGGIRSFCLLRGGSGDCTGVVQFMVPYAPGSSSKGGGHCWIEIFNPIDQARSMSTVLANSIMSTGHNLSKLSSLSAWCAASNRQGEWIMIDCKNVKRLAGVVLQGRHGPVEQWVTSFQVQTSVDGVTFSDAFPADQDGSQDGDSFVSRIFPRVIATRFVKILPKAWHNHISLRFALLVIRGGHRTDDSKRVLIRPLQLPGPITEKKQEKKGTMTGKEKPSEEKETPSEGKETPSEGKATPSEGKEMPSEGKATPSEGKETPSEGKETPEGNATPTPGPGHEIAPTPTPAQNPPAPMQPTEWQCPVCTLSNPMNVAKCTLCQQGERPAASLEAAIAAILPSLAQTPALKPELSMANGWNCATCTFFNEWNRTKCSVCGVGDRPPQIHGAANWICSRCTMINPGNLTVCKACSAISPVEEEKKRKREEEEKKMNDKRIVEQAFRNSAITKYEEAITIPPRLSRLPSLPVALSKTSAVVDPETGRLYIMAGESKGQMGNGLPTAKTYVYSSDDSNWSELEVRKTFTARKDARAAIVGRHILLFGGLGTAGEVLGDIWALDLRKSIPEWKIFPTEGGRPSPCFGCVFTGYGNGAWIFGGSITKEGCACSQLVELQIAEDCKGDFRGFWIQHRKPQTPLPRYNAAFATIQNYLFISGGKGNEGVLNDLVRLDMDKTRWASISLSMKSATVDPRHSALLGATNSRLYLYGGLTREDKPIHSILEFTFESKPTLPILSSLPQPRNPNDHLDLTIVTPDDVPVSKRRPKQRHMRSSGFLSKLFGVARDLLSIIPVGKSNDRARWSAIWQKLPTTSKGRALAGVMNLHTNLVQIDKRLYGISGTGEVMCLSDVRGETNSLWERARVEGGRYAPVTVATCPFNRYEIALCAYGGKMYAFGGISPLSRQMSNQLLIFDPKLNSWFDVDTNTKSPSPPPASSAHMFPIASHLILVHTNLSQVWAFSTINLTWKELNQKGQNPSRQRIAYALGPNRQNREHKGEYVLPFSVWGFGGQRGRDRLGDLFELSFVWDIHKRTISSCIWSKHDLPNPPPNRGGAVATPFPDPSHIAQVAPLFSVKRAVWDSKRRAGATLLSERRGLSTCEQHGVDTSTSQDWQTSVTSVHWKRNTGIHTLRIKIHKLDTETNSYAIVVGVIPSLYDTNEWRTPLGWDSPGYGFITGTGQKLHNSNPMEYNSSSEDSSKVLKEGDIVGIIYDSNIGSLSFSRNSTSLGPAFTIPKTVYSPAISLIGHQHVEILPLDPANPIIAPSSPAPYPNGIVFWGGTPRDDPKTYVLDFSGGGVRWARVQEWGLNRPSGRFGHMMGSIGRRLYAVGGEVEGNLASRTYSMIDMRDNELDEKTGLGEIFMNVVLESNPGGEILDNSPKNASAPVRLLAVWYRTKKEVHVSISNESDVCHVHVVLQWTKLINAKIKLIGKGALEVPPRSVKAYAVLEVPNPSVECKIDFKHVLDFSFSEGEGKIAGGPSFFDLQPPDDALPQPTILEISGGLMASRRRIEIRGVQVEKAPWSVVLRKREGKYAYLELVFEPHQNRILRRIKGPGVSGEEKEGECPLESGTRFVVEIRVLNFEYEIWINRKKFASYTHRLPFENVQQCVVSGDVCITSCQLVDAKWVECSINCLHCKRMANSTAEETTHRLLELQATREAISKENAFASLELTTTLLRRQSSMIRTHKQIRTYQSKEELANVLAQAELLAPIVWECIVTGRLFTDITFPPSNDSIGGDDKHVNQWRRASSFAKNSVLFRESQGAVSSDVVQGELGDCYFLGALSIVANRYDLFKNLFVPTGLSHLGIYTIRFYKDGRWRMVTVDDNVPCRGNGEPSYGRNAQKNEFWVVIAEKAYAKMHHSYHNVDGENGGNIGDALVDLTGGVPEEIAFESIPDEIKSEKLFHKMLDYHRKGYLLACALSPNRKWKATMGIMPNHAYSIIDVRQINETKLIQLRNPYAKEGWTGAWSRNSEVWNDHLRILLGQDQETDRGLFWMSYYDLTRHFNILFVCKVLDESQWGLSTFRSVFMTSNKTAGGSEKKSSRWRWNNQFALSVTETKTRVVICLSQSDARMSYRERAWYQDIGFYVGTAPAKGRRRINTPAGDVYTSEISNRRAVSGELVLDKGEYVIIPCTMEANTEVSYVLTCYMDKKSAKAYRIPTRTDWKTAKVGFRIKSQKELQDTRPKEWIPLSSLDKSMYCTYLTTKDGAIGQAIWTCKTCSKDLDVCIICKDCCHAGHILVPGPKEPRYCDCGKGMMPGGKNACKAMPPIASWRCKRCGTMNSSARTICGVCFQDDKNKHFMIEKKYPRKSVDDASKMREERLKFFRLSIPHQNKKRRREAELKCEDIMTVKVKVVLYYSDKPPYTNRTLSLALYSKLQMVTNVKTSSPIAEAKNLHQVEDIKSSVSKDASTLKSTKPMGPKEPTLKSPTQLKSGSEPAEIKLTAEPNTAPESKPEDIPSESKLEDKGLEQKKTSEVKQEIKASESNPKPEEKPSQPKPEENVLEAREPETKLEEKSKAPEKVSEPKSEDKATKPDPEDKSSKPEAEQKATDLTPEKISTPEKTSEPKPLKKVSNPKHEEKVALVYKRISINAPSRCRELFCDVEIQSDRDYLLIPYVPDGFSFKLEVFLSPVESPQGLRLEHVDLVELKLTAEEKTSILNSEVISEDLKTFDEVSQLPDPALVSQLQTLGYAPDQTHRAFKAFLSRQNSLRNDQMLPKLVEWITKNDCQPNDLDDAKA